MKREIKNQQGNTFLILEYDQVNEWLYANWIGYQPIYNIQKGVLEAVAMHRSQPFTKLLNDNRALIGPWDKANDWLEQILAPETSPMFVQHMAHVISPGIFGQLSVQNLQSRLINKVEIKLFEDINRAQEWLKSK